MESNNESSIHLIRDRKFFQGLFDDCNLLQPLNSDCVQTACSSALPAGNYNKNNKKFNNLGNNTNFWSSTENALAATPTT